MNLFRDKDFVIKRIIPLLLFVVAIYFPIFLQLGTSVLGMWDESLYALRAFYIAFHNEYLVNLIQIEGGFDHPNTKPPLFTFIQAFFFHTFGYTELSLRLPIAISVMFMLFFIVYYFWKEFKSPTIGIFSSLVLVTSPGFMNLHIARTGDHDAVLAFWNLLVFLYFYKLVNVNKTDNKYVWLVALLLAGSVLTKSVAGLFPLPAMFVFAIYRKRLFKLLSSWHTWGAIALFLVLVGSFYLYREWKTPGFLQVVWYHDIAGRYIGINNFHNNPWHYYLDLLYNSDFIPWLFFIPLSIIVLFTKTGKKFREISFYLLFCSLTILLIISNSDTKCEWYHAGMFPLMAIVVGIGINWLHRTIHVFILDEKHWTKLLVTVSFVCLIFVYPYIKIIEQVNFSSKYWIEERYGEFMRKVDPDLKYSVVSERDVNTCVMFYTQVLTKIEDKEVDLKTYNSQYQVGEIVMCSNNTSWVQNRYDISILQDYKDLVLIKITNIK